MRAFRYFFRYTKCRNVCQNSTHPHQQVLSQIQFPNKIISAVRNKFLQINNLCFCYIIKHLHNTLIGIHYAAWGKPTSEMYSYGNILPRSCLSCIFEFPLVPFAFSLILGALSWCLPPHTHTPSKERGTFFQKNTFHGGDKLCQGKFVGGLFYMGGLMIISYQRGKSFTIALSSNLNTLNLKNVTNHCGIFTWR